MKALILYCFILTNIFILLNLRALAQLNPGFNKEECKDMIALCCSFTFLELYNDDSQIIPEGYEKIYNSEAIAMDNIYQLYRKDDIAVICFRGSTSKKISWMANFHAAMLPAKGNITGDLGEINYCFSKIEGATVHGGYAMAIAYMASDLRREILKLHYQGVKDVIITGHSQGGALANLLLALLDHHINDSLVEKVRYKTYSFAAPMVGDELFVEDYNRKFCQTGLSYNIVNPADFVPNLPIELSEDEIASKYVESFGSGDQHISFKELLIEIFIVNSDMLSQMMHLWSLLIQENKLKRN